jgi:hypothetical protein
MRKVAAGWNPVARMQIKAKRHRGEDFDILDHEWPRLATFFLFFIQIKVQ